MVAGVEAKNDFEARLEGEVQTSCDVGLSDYGGDG